MFDFDSLLDRIDVFRSPPEVVIGDGATQRLRGLLEGWSLSPGPLLVVCDKTVAEIGILDRVLDSLAEGRHEVDIFDNVSSEPDLNTADSVVARARNSEYVAVIGLGGGSALDLAKLAAGLATNAGDVLSIVGVNRLEQPALPLVLIPTTAGTGAEATRISMISHDGEKKIINEVKLVARAVILDPLLVASLPPAITAATGMDALSHAIEGALSTNATALSTRSSLGAVELLSKYLVTAYQDGKDLRARRACLFGSYQAGLALNAGSILGHSIGYTIANRVRAPHGASVALALPYCVAYAAPGAKDRIDGLFARVHNPALQYDNIFTWLEQLLNDLEMPMSLKAMGIAKSDLADMAQECVDKYPRANNPTRLEQASLRELYDFMWRGDISGAALRFASA